MPYYNGVTASGAMKLTGEELKAMLVCEYNRFTENPMRDVSPVLVNELVRRVVINRVIIHNTSDREDNR